MCARGRECGHPARPRAPSLTSSAVSVPPATRVVELSPASSPPLLSQLDATARHRGETDRGAAAAGQRRSKGESAAGARAARHGYRERCDR